MRIAKQIFKQRKECKNTKVTTAVNTFTTNKAVDHKLFLGYHKKVSRHLRLRKERGQYP